MGKIRAGRLSILGIGIFLLAMAFLIAACSQQSPQDSIGKGTEVSHPDGQGDAHGGGVKEFKMEAKQFEFSPSTIEVNKGDKVRLIVTSIDVPHGISIPEYGINERLEPNKPVTIEFTADKQGTFNAFCSVFCGSGHRSMKGSIVIK